MVIQPDSSPAVEKCGSPSSIIHITVQEKDQKGLKPLPRETITLHSNFAQQKTGSEVAPSTSHATLREILAFLLYIGCRPGAAMEGVSAHHRPSLRVTPRGASLMLPLSAQKVRHRHSGHTSCPHTPQDCLRRRSHVQPGPSKLAPDAFRGL